jgi:hypothetical protein
MSSTLHVGYVAEMRVCDEEGFESSRKLFAKFRKALKAEKAPTYAEPEDGPHWWTEIHPSNGIAYLQRAAWTLWNNRPLPPVCTDGLDEDILDDMAERLVDKLGFKNKSGQNFDHLCFHHPRHGYWVPVDLPDVLILTNEFGGCVGSSVRLLKECEALAKAIGLPLDMDHNDKVLWHALDHPGEGGETWQRYGIESFNCLRLYCACRKSIELGAAIKLQ